MKCPFFEGLFVSGNNDRHSAADALLKRDERFGGNHTTDFLNTIVEEIHQMLVVTRIKFDEHRVGACGEMAFHDFGNKFELFSHSLIH